VSTDGLHQSAPRPVPELALPIAVSDDDRNRYGVLLDHAAERGLLSPTEYRARLVQVADAPSIEAMQRIVTELPAFGPCGAPTPSPTRPTRQARPPTAGTLEPAALDSAALDSAALDSALWANLTPAMSRRASGKQWLILAVMVVVLLVAMVALALVAAHVAHTHHAALGARVDLFSPIRL
jgi:hypothetical protein